jgi:hypothetical protein
MLTAILTTLIVVAAFLGAFGRDRRGGLIARRPYNNPYNDASGARQDYAG